MKQYEAVIKVMEENGGFATLGHLYKFVLEEPGFEYKTKTPYESIRRIVQTMPELFFKLKPGLWALKSWENKIPEELHPRKGTKRELVETATHTQYQGMIAQMGQWREFATYVPAQDRNRNFGLIKLNQFTSLHEIPPFSYQGFLRIARTVDVVWFNRRGMPSAMYEVENTTDFQNSLLKFYELQDFACKFFIVAPSARFEQFKDKYARDAFHELRTSRRVEFLDYDTVAEEHADAAKRSGRKGF